MTQYYKHGRTPHFDFSPGFSEDDEISHGYSNFKNKEVVISEKIDGENTNFYSDYIHCRSMNMTDHPSRSWVKQLWGNIKHNIPENWRIVGENIYACHSIYYINLPTFFFVFAVYNENNECLSWEETEMFCKELGLNTVPILYKGLWDLNKVKQCFTGKSTFYSINDNPIYLKHLDKEVCPNEQEGFVCRIADKFHYNDFGKSIRKLVRKNHIGTNEFWKTNWIPNKLKEGL